MIKSPIFPVILCCMIGYWMIIIYFVMRKYTPPLQVQYDERQLLDQVVGYKLAFWTMFAFIGFYIVVKEGLGVVWCEDTFALGFAAVSGANAFTTYCIRTDAFFQVGKDAKRQRATANIVCTCSTLWITVSFLSSFRGKPMLCNGLISKNALMPVIVLYLLFMDAMMLCDSIRRKRAKKGTAL